MAVAALCNISSFDAELLKELSQLSITVTLAVVALGISVFQSGEELCGEGNEDRNKREVFLRYIFAVFPVILIALLGFVVSILCEGCTIVLCLHSFVMVTITTLMITKTVASFVAFLNIRD